MSTSMLDAALHYAAQGWHVFPCKPNKKVPCTPNGYHDATDDPQKINAFWKSNPKANIGIALANSGLVAIDVDSHQPDCEWNIFSKGKDIPETLEQKSARGGHHYIFKAPGNAHFVGQLCRGVDIKHKGYILAEPSVFDGKQYQMFNDNDPAAVPIWVPQSGALIAKEQKHNEDRLRAALEGDNWHTHVLQLVGSYVQKGLSDSEIRAFAGGMTLSGYTVEETVSEIQKMIDSARAKGFAPEAPKPIQFIDSAELWEKTIPPIDWVVEPFLPTGLAMMAGPPKVGKSWLALWFAKEAIMRGHGVLYLGFEDSERRLQGRMRLSFNRKPKNKMITFYAGLDAEPFPRGEEALHILETQKKATPHLKLIIIDTWEGIRVPAQKDKNYEQSVEELKPIRKWAHENNVALLIVHHTRKPSDNPGSPLDQILGSQGISATIETALVIKQSIGSQNALVYLTGKDVEQAETEFEWQDPGYELLGHAVETSLGPFQKDCLQVIKEHPNITKTGVASMLQKTKAQAGEAINKLIERGLVTGETVGNCQKLKFKGVVYNVYKETEVNNVNNLSSYKS